MKRLLTLTLCAILLLCSCNGNTTAAPVQTSETEESTPSAPEITAETTAGTITAKTETTIVTNTTTSTEKTYSIEPVSVPIDEFDSLEFNFLEDDIMLHNTISEIIGGAWEYVDLSVAYGFGGDLNIECIEIDFGSGRDMECYFLYDGNLIDFETID